MDLYSRKIISWVLSRTLEATHVVEAVEKAKKIREIKRPLVFHSDRGVQYVSSVFLKATAGMIHSYCGYDSPEQYENQYYILPENAAKKMVG